MRMLFPDAVDDVDPAAVYADLPAAPGRPSLRLNMIVSVDGGTSWNGVSGALGGRADKALFATLRSLTDLVLVASGTMRAEQYGPVVIPPAVQEERQARGQEPVPRSPWSPPAAASTGARRSSRRRRSGPTSSRCPAPTRRRASRRPK